MQELIQFLELIGYSTDERVYFRAFSDKEARKLNGCLATIDRTYKTLKTWNNKGCCVSVIINGQGQADENVKTGRAIFFEHDDLPKQEQLQLWKKLGLPEPTLQVDTGNKSIHSYWVLDKSVPVQDWKKLQSDLLDFSNGDRSIKNPAKPMRAPGFKHQKTDEVVKIVSKSGKKYGYTELRELIPLVEKEKPTLFTQATNVQGIPLENCLSRDDRSLISGGTSQGGRNNTGAKLARGIIGTAKRLDYLGHNYTGNPRQLFGDYCSRCSPALSDKEADQIWQSAEKDNPTATLSDDALENCIKAWFKNQRQKVLPFSKGSSKTSEPNTETAEPVVWDKEKVKQELKTIAGDRHQLKKSEITASLKDIAEHAGWQLREITGLYNEIKNELDQEIELEDDRAEFEDLIKGNKDFPYKIFLPKFFNPIWEWAKNLGVNPEPVLLALEATLASLIDPGTTLLGRKKTNFRVGPTTFSAIVGEPGSKKSPIVKAIARGPLMEMQREAMEHYKTEYVEYERELAEWNNSEEQDKGPEPTPPKIRQYLTGDYTPEALREIAADNPKILRVFDELARENKGRNRYTGGKGNEAQQLLESYDGVLDAMNRKGKHYPSIQVNQSLLGGVQPGVLSEIMSSNDPTGEFARYNVASLDNRPDYWDEDDEKLLDITKLLVGIYKKVEELEKQDFYLDKEASKLFTVVHNRLEDAVKKESNPAIIFQLKKGSGKILRWALLYHIANALALNEKPSQEVPKRYIQIAQYRMDYQIDQVKAIIARMDDTTSSKLSRVYQLALRKDNLTVTQRDVVTRSKLAKTTDEAIECFKKLADMGYGEVVKTTRAIKFVARELTQVSGAVKAVKETPEKMTEAPNTTIKKVLPDKSSSIQTSVKQVSEVSNVDTEPDIAIICQSVRHDYVSETEIEKLEEIEELEEIEQKDNPPKSIDDFYVGQEITYNGSLWTAKIKEIDKSKGMLRDFDDAAYLWHKCRAVNETCDEAF